LSTPTLVVLEGDQTGQELLLEALRVLDPRVTGVELRFERYDLSLEKRRATGNAVVLEAAEAMRHAPARFAMLEIAQLYRQLAERTRKLAEARQDQ